MPKAATIALSMISMLAAVGLLIARQWVAAGVAIAVAVAFDFVLVRTLIADAKSRCES
jgi:hypothetical protein